ncbi:MAG: 2-C-methyl-D-erythritol 2,4-cyclodiphosphate synthase [Clostridia bacterium]|nr:2-C-methyl-D-erythritol 2,4-cyclodiphosphate synthase [Clostridia bacterium]
MRIGQGYDVHRFADSSSGRALILGGVSIPFGLGLLGHSDADVLAHAIMDALLGACALGDIGMLFPDTDEEYRGADSLKLLARVCGIVRSYGYEIGNIDSTIVAQSPRLSPYITEMRECVAGAAGIEMSRVSIKATTEEGLGFTGAGLGIAAQAIVLLTE